MRPKGGGPFPLEQESRSGERNSTASWRAFITSRFTFSFAGKLLEIFHHAGAQPLAAKFGSQRHKADLGFIAAHKEATHGDGRSVGEHQPVNGDGIVASSRSEPRGRLKVCAVKFPAQLIVNIQLRWCFWGDYPVLKTILSVRRLADGRTDATISPGARYPARLPFWG